MEVLLCIIYFSTILEEGKRISLQLVEEGSDKTNQRPHSPTSSAEGSPHLCSQQIFVQHPQLLYASGTVIDSDAARNKDSTAFPYGAYLLAGVRGRK